MIPESLEHEWFWVESTPHSLFDDESEFNARLTWTEKQQQSSSWTWGMSEPKSSSYDLHLYAPFKQMNVTIWDDLTSFDG